MTWTTGAVPHEPRHSTSTIAKRPSAVAVPDLMPSSCFRGAHESARVTRQHGRLAQTWMIACGLGLIEQRIERGDFGDLARAHTEMLADFGEDFRAERAEFVARHVQRKEQCAAGVGKMRDFGTDFFVGRSRQ